MSKTVEIPLTRGAVALVDAEDAAEVGKFKWYLKIHRDGHRYAGRTERADGRRTEIKLHRFILKAAKGDIIDHRDGDGLNNTRANLRLCTKAQNNYNTKTSKQSPFGLKGVNRYYKGYRARIRINKKMVHLGIFQTAEEAHAAYCKAAEKLFGEFARFA